MDVPVVVLVVGCASLTVAAFGLWLVWGAWQDEDDGGADGDAPRGDEGGDETA